MERGERNLRRAGEIEAVLGRLVEVALVGREEARAVHRLVTHEHRRQHRRVALLHDPRERPAVERDLEQRHVADAVHEARARDLCAALDVDPAVGGGEIEMIARLEVEARRLADDPHDDGVLLLVAVGRVLGRGVRHAIVQILEPLRRLGQLGLERLQLGLERGQLGELLRSRLAFQLRARPQLIDALLELAPADIGGEQLVEDLGRALARECRPVAVGVVAGCAQVDHRFEFRSASSTCARLPPLRRGRSSRRPPSRGHARSRRRCRTRPIRRARRRSRRRRRRSSALA